MKNKQFVFNPNFQFRYLVQDEFELGITSHNEDNIGIEHFDGLSR